MTFHSLTNVTVARATLMVCFLAALLPGCASIRTPNSTRTGHAMSAKEVSITRTAVLPGTPNDVFTFISAEDVLPKILTGYGPLPAVLRTSENSGPWDQPGSTRLIHLADGSTVREQVTEFAAPTRFAYRVWDFGNPIIKTLANGARGEWQFSATPQGTHVVWTYTFTAKSSLAALPLSAITQILWRGYMDVCLENSQRLLAETSRN
jgi:hypothetical protein